MNKFFTTILLFLICFTVFAKSGKVIISGKIKNHSITSIEISQLNNQELVSAKLDSHGEFRMSTTLEEGYYLLEYGRNTAYIYLYPKDELTINFDAKYFENTLIFDGQGAGRNNYLVKKSKIYKELTKDLDAFYKVDELNYLKNIQKVKSSQKALFSQFNLEDFFITAEKKSLEYERLLSIQNYKSNYKFYLGDEITPSKNFYDPIKKLNVNSEKDYSQQPYYRYLVNSIWSKRIDAAPNVEEMLKVLRKVPSQALAINLINGFYGKISSNKERSKDYLDLIKSVTKYQPFIEASEKRFEEVMKAKGLVQGDVSPTFSYETLDGEIIKLSDLKGKYVYIDVWATWCAPCIKQVPYLKKLEKRYHDKNIVFVSISVDKKEVKPTWKQMVNDKELGGLQLFADKSFDSDFMNAFAVNSIPRFILIDPKGNIVDPEAPRPSFDKTRVLLDRLLN